MAASVMYRVRGRLTGQRRPHCWEVMHYRCSAALVLAQWGPRHSRHGRYMPSRVNEIDRVVPDISIEILRPRRPVVVRGPGGAGDPPAVWQPVRQPVQSRMVPAGAGPNGNRVSVNAPGALPAQPAGMQRADTGAETVEALTQQMAASRARMLMDTESGRFAERPRGISADSSTGSAHLRTRASDTVRVTEITRANGAGATAASPGAGEHGNQAASVNTAVREQSDIRRPATIPLLTRRPS
jgi:hypothetical protein